MSSNLGISVKYKLLDLNLELTEFEDYVRLSNFKVNSSNMVLPLKLVPSSLVSLKIKDNNGNEITNLLGRDNELVLFDPGKSIEYIDIYFTFNDTVYKPYLMEIIGD